MDPGLICLRLRVQIGFKACSAGPKEQEANNSLEKRVKANPDMTLQQAVEVRRICIARIDRRWPLFSALSCLTCRLPF